MNANLPRYNDASVLVVGDVMLDRYMTGAARRISPEAPVPVVNVGETEDRPGGAANVAQSIVALGAGARLIGLTGDDDDGTALAWQLTQHAVETDFVRVPDLPTIVKLRVLSHGQQLLRLDFEQDFKVTDTSPLLEKFASQLMHADVIVLSDYAKGTLADAAEMIGLAQKAGVPVMVDPKGTDFSKYRGAAVVTPNMGEFEAVVGACSSDDDLVAKARNLIKQYSFGALLITRSEKGMTLVPADAEVKHLPTRAVSVSDVTGAGDTVISTLAASLAAGAELSQACELANMAAGIVVTKVGTSTVTRAELAEAVSAQDITGSGVQDKEALLQTVERARRRGEKIVMTNGCFDILHAGHVSYLNTAAQLGDRLIVAVNSDESVSRLKGPTRPVIPAEQRKVVLAALSAVDWVVEFSEDTPEKLIASVLPDVLVKGGDYRVEEIAGHRQVLDNGGSVEILQFEDGCSTSSIIEAIQAL